MDALNNTAHAALPISNTISNKSTDVGPLPKAAAGFVEGYAHAAADAGLALGIEHTL